MDAAMPGNAMEDFADKVVKLMPDIMREFLKRQTREFSQGNISLPQTLILDILKDKPSMRMGELAEYLSVSMAAATGIVERLFKGGYVLRGGVPYDRRIVNISATSKGKKIIKSHNQARQKAIIEMFGVLSLEDRDRYLEILSKIQRHLKHIEE